MGLFNFVKKDYAPRMLRKHFNERRWVRVAEVSRRRPEELADAMAFLKLRHVKPKKFRGTVQALETRSECQCALCFPDTRGADKHEGRRAPHQLVVNRYYNGGIVVRSVVERADAAWVHGRGKNTRLASLRGKTIAVLGCGSLGAALALNLAGAGVGNLLLIDPQLLRWANVERHPLGAAGVGRAKAVSLAEKIRSDYPHILGVRPITSRWEEAGAELKTLASCDLVVSAIGDWAAEAALNEWHRANRQGPVVYGWTEAHACAGHAVAILQPAGCLQCGFTNSGIPLFQVTEWPGSTVHQEPACGTSFQPYGVVELGHIISVVAEMALDCVLGAVKESKCRTWVGRQSLLENAGGKWTDSWLEIAAGRLKGGFIEEREWPLSHSCIECGAKAA